MSAPLFHIGLPSTIWLSSVVIAFADYISPVNFGPIGAVSWLIVLSGVVYFMKLIFY